MCCVEEENSKSLSNQDLFTQEIYKYLVEVQSFI